MKKPLDALVATTVNLLNTDLREEFEERAGIMEFDAELPRAHAECLALLNVLRRHPTALSGVTVLKAVVNGTQQCLLTTDLNVARKRFAALGGSEIGVIDLKEVVERQFGGLARVASVD